MWSKGKEEVEAVGHAKALWWPGMARQPLPCMGFSSCNVNVGLDWHFSPWHDSALSGHLAHLETFWVVTASGWKVLLASGGWGPGRLLYTLQGVEQHHSKE